MSYIELKEKMFILFNNQQYMLQRYSSMMLTNIDDMETLSFMMACNDDGEIFIITPEIKNGELEVAYISSKGIQCYFLDEGSIFSVLANILKVNKMNNCPVFNKYKTNNFCNKTLENNFKYSYVEDLSSILNTHTKSPSNALVTILKSPYLKQPLIENAKDIQINKDAITSFFRETLVCQDKGEQNSYSQYYDINKQIMYSSFLFKENKNDVYHKDFCVYGFKNKEEIGLIKNFLWNNDTLTDKEKRKLGRTLYQLKPQQYFPHYELLYKILNVVDLKKLELKPEYFIYTTENGGSISVTDNWMDNCDKKLRIADKIDDKTPYHFKVSGTGEQINLSARLPNNLSYFMKNITPERYDAFHNIVLDTAIKKEKDLSIAFHDDDTLDLKIGKNKGVVIKSIPNDQFESILQSDFIIDKNTQSKVALFDGNNIVQRFKKFMLDHETNVDYKNISMPSMSI